MAEVLYIRKSELSKGGQKNSAPPLGGAESYQNLPLLPEWLPEEWLWETLSPEDEELFSLGLGVRVTVRRRKWSDCRVSCMEPGTA